MHDSIMGSAEWENSMVMDDTGRAEVLLAFLTSAFIGKDCSCTCTTQKKEDKHQCMRNNLGGCQAKWQ